MTKPEPEDLAVWSKRLHGHGTVLPVADLIMRADLSVASPPEVVRGLLGQSDKARVIEALAKLAEIGALRELPRGKARNATRYFERVDESPYWDFLPRYLADIGTSAAGLGQPGSAPAA